MDVWNARSPVLVIGIVGSMILSFVWVVLVRFFVGCIVWTTIVLVLLWLFFFGVWSYLHSDIFDTTLLTSAVSNSIAAIDSSLEFVDVADYGLTEATFNFTSAGSTFNFNTGIFDFSISTSLLYTIAAVTCTVLFVAVLIVVIIFCKKIRIAIAIIKEASKAIQKMPCLPFLPFVTGFFTLALFALFVWMAAFIYSLEFITVGTVLSSFQEGIESAFAGVNCTHTSSYNFTELEHNITEIQRLEALGIDLSETEFAGMDVSTLVAEGQQLLLQVQGAPSYAIGSICSGLQQLQEFGSYELDTVMLFFHLFAWLWTNQIVAAIGICVISGAVADWYFTRPSGDPSRKGGDGKSFQSPILRSAYRTCRFHLGSLIFGSAIIATVQFIRYIMMWVDEKTKDWQKKNKCFQNMFKVIHCLLKCFEKCLKYITVNAYIMVAMRGYSFCDSCCRGVKLLFDNMAQFMLVACFSRVIIIMGKLVIVAAAIASLYFWLTYDPFFNAATCHESFFKCDGTLQLLWGGPVTLTFIPILLGGFLSYVCARSFLFVYDMTIQTILLCFCEDCRVHQIEESTDLAKQLHKEAYMPKELRRIILPSKEYEAMKDPMTLEEVMALDPDYKPDEQNRELDAGEIVDVTKKILLHSDEGLHGELDLDKLKDNKALLKKAGGQPLWEAYRDVKDNKGQTAKFKDVVNMIHAHLGEQGLLKKWTRPPTQEEIDQHFNDTGVVTAEEVKSVQHGRLDSDFAKSQPGFQDISGGGAKLQPNLHQPRESDVSS